MASTKNSLVMGVATRYPPELITPFLRSLRETSYQGRICLLVGDMTEAAQEQLRLLADDVINLDGIYGKQINKYHLRKKVQQLYKLRNTRGWRRLYPALFQLIQKRAPSSKRVLLRNDIEKFAEGFQSLRYSHYLDYIHQHASEADYVMISDVRDVIFQRDPFDHEFSTGLEVFLESPSITIETNSFNREWIEDLYGSEGLKEIGSQIVCCSGTTMGTRQEMERYLGLMMEEISKYDRPMGSHDQGVHNYLLRTGKLDPVTIYSNGYAPVLTMGMEAMNMLSQNEQGEILNTDGQVTPVVHQYDRYPALADQMNKRFSP